MPSYRWQTASLCEPADGSSVDGDRIWPNGYFDHRELGRSQMVFTTCWPKLTSRMWPLVRCTDIWTEHAFGQASAFASGARWSGGIRRTRGHCITCGLKRGWSLMTLRHAFLCSLSLRKCRSRFVSHHIEEVVLVRDFECVLFEGHSSEVSYFGRSCGRAVLYGWLVVAQKS